MRPASARAAIHVLTTTIVAAGLLTAAPAHASDLPVFSCRVNGADAPPSRMVQGTSGPDRIECENDVRNVVIWGAGGNDYIRVKGMVVNAQVLGGDGDDSIQVNNLVPATGDSMVRGDDGNDTIITALVYGSAEHGAEVRGDMGDDTITTGSVMGQPGEFQRGGGQVFGNDGQDRITTGTVDLGGRVLGGSEDDVIEPKAVGVESAGIIMGGPGRDKIRGREDTQLVIGPGYGQVDGGPAADECKVRHSSTGERIRSTLSGCP
ncbi:hypothetical protein LG634_11275 [Streptomyces bambusae]|uniref:hypothetical protein n=1 Tax=Streptomyces bambusae TaxID=1550616 RepID=UPI001CFE8D38|nr:hypothetical protein [Streptomyces bambusae]MCB5165409.1 hypothetical protein [Streptomyces bambusae]